MEEKTTLEKLDGEISTLVYQNLVQEQLARLYELEDYYVASSEQLNHETFTSDVNFVEQLSNDFILPLKVRGVFLSEGKPLAKWYPAEELEAAAMKELNQSFPLMLDHRKEEASQIVGKVTKVRYDPKIRALRWWGHINDETHARNVLDGVISQVSVTVYSEDARDEEYGRIGTNLTFGELSLVRRGRDKMNSLEVDK